VKLNRIYEVKLNRIYEVKLNCNFVPFVILIVPFVYYL